MRRTDIIKLNFIRNWNFPGKERLSHWFKPSDELKTNLKDGIVALNNEDIVIYTTADNYIEWTILNTGTYEHEIAKLIKISLKDGDIALDIGANIGLQSLRMAECVGPGGKVYAFEPLTHLQQKLSNNLQLNRVSNVELMPIALSNVNEERTIKVDLTSWNQGTFSLNNAQGPIEQNIAIRTGDTLPKIQDLDHLALIKIDVEGFEFQVLLGLTETLKKHKPRIIFEYDPNYWAPNGQKMVDCFRFLSDMNYKVYQINPVGGELVTLAEQITSGNIFCL